MGCGHGNGKRRCHVASSAQLTEAINKAINFLNRVKFLDSEDIIFIDEGIGWSARLRSRIPEYTPLTQSSGGGSSSYSGYFAVTNASDDETVQVAIAAGQCRINIYDFYVSEQNKTITATGYVYLTATMGEDGVVAAPTIAFAESAEGTDVPPGYEDYKFNAALAKVTFGDGAISSIEQIQYGFLYGNAWGPCNG